MSSSSGGLIGDCFNGTISSSCADVTISGTASVGGLIGYLNGAELFNSYATGVLTGTSSNNGGLVGTSSAGKTTNCYSTVSIEKTSGSGLIGLFVGSTVINSYYDSLLAGRDSDSDKGIPKSTAEMKLVETFNNWNFYTVWAGDNSSYPKLASQVSGWGEKSITSLALPDTILVFGGIDKKVPYNLIPLGSNENLIFDVKNSAIVTASSEGILQFASKGETKIVVSVVGNSSLKDSATVIAIKTFSGGDGTASNPYHITNVEELNSMRYFITSHFIVMNDIDLLGSPYDSANSVDNVGWIPIGTWDDPFGGVLDGNGHTIKNLYVNRPGKDYAAFFGRAYDCEIKDLHFSNVRTHALTYAASIVGSLWNSSISGCSSSGNVSAERGTSGGLCGNVSKTTVTNCYSTCDVTGYSSMGGLIGDYSGSVIDGCYATGNVYAVNNFGGLVGYNHGTIKNSYATGTVYTYELLVRSLGGLTGISGAVSEVYHSYAVGKVYETAYTTIDEIGGLVGRAATSETSTATITDCYYDSVTTTQTNAKGVPLSTKQMRSAATFANWDFSTVWAISEGNTYPVLKNVNNAPFAFADTVAMTASIDGKILLANDYDYETAQANLVIAYDSIGNGHVNGNTIYPNSTLANGDTVFVFYRVGEALTTKNDTLWGSRTTSICIYNNSAPQFVKKSYACNEDEKITVPASQLVVDSDNDPLTTSIITNSFHGEMTLTNGSLQYTPNENFFGKDSVTLSVTDGALTTTAIITFLVASVNDAPTMIQNSFTISEEDAFVVSVSYFSSDIDGDDVTATLLTDAKHGTIDLFNNNMDFAYVPNKNFFGKDSVQLIFTDKDLYDTAWIYTTVTAVNDAPTITKANDQTVLEDGTIEITLSMSDASDVDNTLSDESVIVEAGSGYTLSGRTVIPNKNYNGVITVPVKVTDGEFTTSSVNMKITVASVNDAPTLTTVDEQTIDEDASLAILLSMTNGVDGDNMLTDESVVVDAGDNYTVSGVTVTPTANFNGELTVPVRITDGEDTTSAVNMKLTVRAVQDAPTLTNVSSSTILSGDSKVIALDMTDAEDVDGDKLTLLVKSSDANCTVNGTTITPVYGFVGLIIYEVAVTDDIDTTEYVTAGLTVDVPTATNEIITFAKEGYSLKVAPTPTKDSGKVLVVSEESGDVVFTLFNSNEKTLAKIVTTVNAGEKITINWDVIEKLTPNIYFIEMKVNGEVKAITTLVKIE